MAKNKMRKTQMPYHIRTNYSGGRELVLYNILDSRLCGYIVTVHEITGNRARLSVESSRGVKKHTLRLYHTNGGEYVKLPLNTGEKRRVYIEAEELENRHKKGADRMTPQEIKENKTLKYHHTGSRRGYESRKGGGHAETYKGRFGEGYIIIRPRWDTTRYVYIDYYIKKEG